MIGAGMAAGTLPADAASAIGTPSRPGADDHLLAVEVLG